MRTRSIRLMAGALVLGLLLAACSEKDDKGSDGTKDTTGGSQAALTVCSDIPYPPLEDFKEGSETEFTGFDIDLMQYIADHADRKLDVRVTPFDGIFTALDSKACDVIASALTINDERKKGHDFSEPYYDSKQSLVIRAEDKGTITKLEDLAGKTIGVQSETTGQAYAEEHAPATATVKAYPGSSDLFTAINAKEIDAILQDGPVNVDGVSKAAGDLVYLEEFDTEEQYGFAVRKGDTATKKLLDDGLEAARQDGTYDRLYAQYLEVKQ